MCLSIKGLKVSFVVLYEVQRTRGQKEPKAEGPEGSNVFPRLRADGFILEQETPGSRHCPSHRLSPPEDEKKCCAGL